MSLCGCTGSGELPGVPMGERALASSSPALTAVLDPLDPSEQDVWQLHDRMVGCLMTPATCEVEQVALEGSPAWTELERTIEQRRVAGWEAMATHLPPRRELLRMWPMGDTWHVELCWVDNLVLHDSGRGDGRSILVDDGIITLAEAWTLVSAQGAWRVSNRHVTRVTPGDSSWCR